LDGRSIESGIQKLGSALKTQASNKYSAGGAL
jgi:hypothetical protein